MPIYKNRIFQITAIILLLLMLLNPSYTRFKEYSQELTNARRKVVYKRTFNGLVFSIYQKKIFDVYEGKTPTPKKSEKYLGFFMNFFKIENNNLLKTPSSDSLTNTYISKFSPDMVDNKRDPSCGMLVDAGIEDTVHYKNKVLGFCSKECKDEFLKDPEKNIASADLKK